jgi:hypothetical protein
MSVPSMLDQSALKFNQFSIVLLTTLGFIFDQPALPAFVALVLVAGSITPQLAAFKLLYRHVLKPLNIVKPKLVDDSPEPHEFAQMLGGTVLAIGVLFLLFGSRLLGWGVAWVVILLALANLVFGFCAGCFVYFQLGKLGIVKVKR